MPCGLLRRTVVLLVERKRGADLLTLDTSWAACIPEDVRIDRHDCVRRPATGHPVCRHMAVCCLQMHNFHW